MNYDFRSFVHMLRGVDPQLNGFCPFHNDHNPSFSCNTDSGLWICHAGCGSGTYEMFLKMFRSDLDYGKRARKAVPSSQFPKSQQFQLVAEYHYQNWQGMTCLRVKRFEDGLGSKRFFQESLNKDKIWLPGVSKEILAPYKYESWKETRELILVVEGEKCADFLSRLRFNATTVPGGANGWKDSFVPFFKDKIVRIIPDNDSPGKDFALQVMTALQSVSPSIRIVNLPGLSQSGDAWDWFNGSDDRSDINKMQEFLKLIL